MDTHKGLIEYDEAYKSTTDFMKHDNDESVEPLQTSIFRNSTRTQSVPELLTLDENHGLLDKLSAPRCNKLDLYNQEEIEYLYEPEPPSCIESFEFKDGKLIFNTSTGSISEVANFCINEIKKYDIYDFDTESKKAGKIELSIINSLGEQHVMKMPVADYYKLGDIVRASYPECIVYIPKSRLFNKYLLESYINDKVEAGTIYTGTGGWKKIDKNWVYFCTNENFRKSDRYLYRDIKSAQKFLKFFDHAIQKDNIKAILLLYLLWAHTSKLWKSISDIASPQAVLWLVGYTNSGKSTIAKALSGTLYEDPSIALMQFEGTEAAIDALLKDNQEQLICIDDFYPTYGEKKNDFNNKVNHLIRIVGDGQLKAKCTQNSKLEKGRQYYGGVIVTGESIDIQNQSSLTRCIIVSLTETDIQKDKNLSKLSNSPRIVNSFITEWINWLEKNQDTLNKYIKKSHDKYFDKATNSDNIARQNTLSLSFHILADLVERFMENTFDTHPPFITNLHYELNLILDEQRIHQKQLSPSEICKNVLIEAIESGQIIVAHSKEDFIRSKEANAYVEICDDEEYIVITHTAFKSSFITYAKTEGKALLFTSIKQHLVKVGLMKNASDIRGSRFSLNRLATNPKRPWVVHIKKSILGSAYSNEF